LPRVLDVLALAAASIGIGISLLLKNPGLYVKQLKVVFEEQSNGCDDTNQAG
jgi:hypothetical protein